MMMKNMKGEDGGFGHNYNFNSKYYNNKVCINCNKKGHYRKTCTEPVNSYGVILVDIGGSESMCKSVVDLLLDTKIDCSDISTPTVLTPTSCITSLGIMCQNSRDYNIFQIMKNHVKFLMVQRKFTLGFSDFIRGLYELDNIDYVKLLFSLMTPVEINNIKNHKNSFIDLWELLWSSKSLRINEYVNAEQKFNIFVNDEHNFDICCNNSTSGTNAEWGFPKGRRNHNETDNMCGLREFMEETGWKNKEYIVVNNINPLVEKFIGTNGINYQHSYQVAVNNSSKQIDINDVSVEIGNIGWFTYEECINVIDDHHVKRKQLITELFNIVMNSIIQLCNHNTNTNTNNIDINTDTF